MQPVIKKTSDGTWLVRSEPIPFGKTAADVSVVVQKYRWGWFCYAHRRVVKPKDKYGISGTNCSHLDAVQSMQ